MNIYYMGENLANSDFPIEVWNSKIDRNIKVTQLPPGNYESKLGRWGDPEKGGVGADAGLRSVNTTDDTRTDTFPKGVKCTKERE